MLSKAVNYRLSSLAARKTSARLLSTPSDYEHTSGNFDVTSEMKAAFDRDGYIIGRRIFKSDEISKLQEALETDGGIMQHAYAVNDGQGRSSRLCIWSHPGQDITGMVARSEKIAGTMEKLLGGEVYHYHTKLMMKEAYTGGSFIWHQDYGYWYMNGCLFPDMGTAFIAIDRCDEENGCLEVVRGSNRLGRIEHGRVGGQTGADESRIKEVLKALPVDRAVLDPGDVLFFHSNLLHKSNRNDSSRRRWAFLCAYNRASNNPVIEHHHPRYTPLEKVSNTAIQECTNYTDMTGKDFLDPKNDKTADGKK